MKAGRNNGPLQRGEEKEASKKKRYFYRAHQHQHQLNSTVGRSTEGKGGR